MYALLIVALCSMGELAQMLQNLETLKLAPKENRSLVADVISCTHMAIVSLIALSRRLLASLYLPRYIHPGSITKMPKVPA